MNAITPTGVVFNDFDAVDIAIITDKTLDKAYDEIEKQAVDDELDGVSESSLLHEETYCDFVVEAPNTDDIDTEEDSDVSLLGAEADEYIDALDSEGLDDVGDIIDLVAGI